MCRTVSTLLFSMIELTCVNGCGGRTERELEGDSNESRTRTEEGTSGSSSSAEQEPVLDGATSPWLEPCFGIAEAHEWPGGYLYPVNDGEYCSLMAGVNFSEPFSLTPQVKDDVLLLCPEDELDEWSRGFTCLEIGATEDGLELLSGVFQVGPVRDGDIDIYPSQSHSGPLAPIDAPPSVSYSLDGAEVSSRIDPWDQVRVSFARPLEPKDVQAALSDDANWIVNSVSETSATLRLTHWQAAFSEKPRFVLPVGTREVSGRVFGTALSQEVPFTLSERQSGSLDYAEPGTSTNPEISVPIDCATSGCLSILHCSYHDEWNHVQSHVFDVAGVNSLSVRYQVVAQPEELYPQTGPTIQVAGATDLLRSESQDGAWTVATFDVSEESEVGLTLGSQINCWLPPTAVYIDGIFLD